MLRILFVHKKCVFVVQISFLINTTCETKTKLEKKNFFFSLLCLRVWNKPTSVVLRGPREKVLFLY